MAIQSAIGNLWIINYYNLLENVGVKGIVITMNGLNISEILQGREWDG
jgi:hypothetical protein